MRKIAAIALILVTVPLTIAVAQTRIQGGGSAGPRLQPTATTTTNPLQTGNLHLNGNVVIGSSNPTQAFLSQVTVGFPPGSDRLFLGTGGAAGAIEGGLSFGFYPAQFSSGLATSGSKYHSFYGVKSNSPIMQIGLNSGTGSLSVTGVASSG